MKLPELDVGELKDFKDWAGSNDLSISDYLFSHGNLDLAIAFAEYFWPKVVEAEGCYLFAPNYSRASLTDWLDSLEGDKSRVEAVMNHVHIYGLFENPTKNYGEYDLKVYEYFAPTMQQTWQAALQMQLPEVKFDVVFATEPDDYGPTVTFYAVR